MPIKKCEDLMPLIGKLIVFDKEGFAKNQRNMPLPLIKLGPHFSSVIIEKN